uniref:IS66 family insertion sequence element accessory protein TnpB n=1 Tax=Yunchengibacter salinarum TaxID=3133399 RepID=UPI0035B6389A
MIAPGAGVRVYLACGVTDMRKGIAGLSAIAQDVLRQKPASGAVFVFRGRRGDRVKLLYRKRQLAPTFHFVLGDASPFLLSGKECVSQCVLQMRFSDRW